MRITTRKIRVIEMTSEEIEKFHRLMQLASEGHTSHYAEERLYDGSFLGVAIVSPPRTVSDNGNALAKPASPFTPKGTKVRSY